MHANVQLSTNSEKVEINFVKGHEDRVVVAVVGVE
jgi:hypothetical protein